MSKAPTALKRILVGRPMSSGELEHTLLPKLIALPVFSSDPLSSNAYATQEALLVLALAGSAGLSLIAPISIAVAALLAIVVTSYRQTVRAYPTGGGAYRVSRENLGMSAGLLAASALLVDYVLTVSVSITAGVEAITSASPGLHEHSIGIAFAFIALVTVLNLRGVKESGSFFAIPTYGFVISIYLMIVAGLIDCVNGCPRAESASLQLHPETAVGIMLVLRAFAAGTTALTGVEAIADGVPAFRYPQSRNAAATLGIMGALSISMFLGISWLADHTGVVYLEGVPEQRSVVAQISLAVFGGGPLFYLVQIMSAAILILAANTAFQDFPRLSSILAQDRFVPRQFMNRGDRLVFSNGVLILAVLAGFLIYIFGANLTRLIQLYLIGVFVSFTLSQTGMVLRGLRLKPPGWKRSAWISGIGATATAVVLCVVVATKFSRGAWIVIVAIPALMYLMHSVYRHYTDLALQLTLEERRPADRRPGNHHLVILVHKIDAAARRALSYARSIPAEELTAVAFDPALEEPWRQLAADVPLTVLAAQGSRRSRLKHHLRERRRELASDDFLTLVVPELLKTRSLFEIFTRPALHRLKAALLPEHGIQVLDVPVVEEDVRESNERVAAPARNYAVVLVAAVHNATLQAIEYAETLQATDLRAVSFGLDPEETERVGRDWIKAGIPLSLELRDSPFRDIGSSLVRYIRQFNPDGVNRVVTVIMPEFVVSKRRHTFLHGQTALVVKRHLLFERGVVAVSVPYRV